MIFAKSLAKKIVLLSDGTVVGIVYNITSNLKTGSLINLLIKPRSEVPELQRQNGLYIVPFESVRSISDYIILDRRKLRI
jgi:sporulation protein YlmC with PRC-barrel domain